METITIEQKNEEIAKMLGWLFKDDIFINTCFGIPSKHIKLIFTLNNFMVQNNICKCGSKQLQFNSDWNWLMEAVKFINSTHKQNIGYRDLIYTLNGLASGGYWNGSTEKQPGLYFNSIEEVFDAVYRFAKSWNKKNGK